MTPDRYRRVGEIYHAALDVKSGERGAFLEGACGSDEELRREVESLLEAHKRAGDLFASPAMEVAAGLLADARSPSLVGRRISHYQVLSLLGAGGMGEVYLAQDTRLGRKVALKWLPAQITTDADRLRRFEQEARAVSALNHPNIVTVHDIGSAENGRFLVMELVEGRTLRALLAEGPAPAELVRLGEQMASALSVAHGAGIIHRDIKPENIMVRDDGYVKVLDFGLARLAATADPLAEAETEARTDPGALLGTFKYMSPEQARGEAISRASDVFSLGLVFYELATGTHPFASPSHLRTLNAIVSQTPLPPNRVNPALPPTLDALILRMLAKDGRLRPSSAEVGAALQDLANRGEPTGEPAVVRGSGRHVVGHEKERAELRAAFESVAGGTGLLLSIAGEPGIGKTTLVDGFLEEVRASGRPCWIGRGSSSERLAGSEAYLPLLEALESLLRGESGGTAESALRRLAPSWYAQIAPLSSQNDSDARILAAARTGSQERMKRELRGFFHEISARQPVVLFFDDLQWADVSTIDQIAWLASHFRELPLLIVACYRPSDMLLARHPFLRLRLDLQARGSCRDLALDFLSAEDIGSYLDLEFPEHRFPHDLPRSLHARTEGSPLFMTDLVRYLRKRGVIAEQEGRWVLAGPLREVERDLPESVRGMIERKIAELDEDDRRALTAASVQGHEFDSVVVAQLLELDPAGVEERLETLEGIHGFLRLVGERELPDGTLTRRYRFVHVLYQNALYGSLGPARRAPWSRGVADALSSHYGAKADEVALELANLFEAARDFEKAVDFFSLAAENAARVFAYQETAILARRGMGLLERLPDTSQRDRRELNLLTVLGPALFALSGYAAPEVIPVYARARELSERSGETRELFTVLYNTWLIYDLRGDFASGRDVAERCLTLAEKSGDSAYRLMARVMLGETSLWLGEFAPARGHYVEANRSYDFREHHALALLHGGYDPGVAGRSIGAHALWYLGYPDQALQESRTGLSLAEESSHPLSLALALCHAGFLHHLRRERRQARERAESALDLSLEQGLTFWASYARIRGRTLVEEGDPVEGLAQIVQGIAEYQAQGSEVEVPFFTALLAEACAAEGRTEEGLRAVNDALAYCQNKGVRFHEAELLRLRGELLLKALLGTAEEEAEGCFRRALELAREQSAKSLELRAAMSRLRLASKRGGDHAGPREELASIYRWFTEGLEIPDLTEARTLLGVI